jgi:hypothetical protein
MTNSKDIKFLHSFHEKRYDEDQSNVNGENSIAKSSSEKELNLQNESESSP